MIDVLLVKLDIIKENIEIIKKITNCDLIAVVKSNAYGIGVKYLVPFYQKIGIKYFFVNHYDEYQVIAPLLGKTQVIIMDSIKLKNDDKIIYTINSYQDALEVVNAQRKVTIHLQVDLKMNRLGIKSKAKMIEILSLLKKNPLIQIEGIYGHFPLSIDNVVDYKYLSDYFLEFTKLYPFKMIHACATPSLHKPIVGNFVRVGLGVYGMGNPYLKLKNAIAAYEKPIDILNLDIGDKVGYEADNNVITKPSKVAVIPIGYYEVFNLDYISYLDQKYPKIGNSCMNHSHFIVDDKINNLTYLSILKKNDTIDIEKINPYHYLINLSNYRKIYIMRYQNDIFRINKRKYHPSRKFKFRINSCQDVNPRIIRF